MPCRARGIDHVLRLRPRRTLVGILLFDPGFKLDRKIGRGQMIRIDLVLCEDFRRRRRAEDGDPGRNYPAQPHEPWAALAPKRRRRFPPFVGY